MIDLTNMTSPLPMPDLQSMNLQTPQVQGGGGMFGAGSPWRYALASALSGFVSRRNPQLAEQMMAPLQMQRQMQMMGLQQQFEYQRQLALAQAQAQLKMQYPDNDFAVALRQSGVMPGTPQWTQAMGTKVGNELDPIVNVENVGPMTRSQALSLQSAHAQTPAAPAVGTIDGGYRFKGGDPSNPSSWEPVGGQTPQASGHFLGS